MASTSSCEPTPQKRLKIEDKVIENDPNAWRSKLTRIFNEVDVGITEFIGKHQKFEGILKNRYEDFVVHEITKSGQMVRLTNNEIPEQEVIPLLDVDEVLNDSTIEEIKELCEEFDDEKVDEDEEELNGKKDELKDNKSDKSVKILVTGMDKSERTRIHKAIRDNFSGLETLTIDEQLNKYIIVKKEDKNPKRKRSVWPKSKGEYIHFVLYKENKETQQAINELALKMHISPKNFSFAGTKDKRAIATQQVCAWKVPPKKIWYASQKLMSTEVGHFTFQKEALKLGDLSGNHFDIILRDIKCDDREDAESALNSVKNIGFINYYGMQRFGHQHEKPYKIGVNILQQKWKEVVELILSPKAQDMKSYRDSNGLSFNECIELWKTTQDANLVYEKFGFKSTPEGTLLRGLSRVAKNDFHGALCTGMVRNTRLLYLHCYQSYLWNKAASYRVKTYGLEVVVGDLLLINSNCDNETETDNNNTSNNDSNKTSDGKGFHSNIVYADQNNIKDASIYDIVIPIIGSENLLPKNSTSDFINSLLTEDDVTIDLFRQLPKQWLVYGSYRKLFARPDMFHWSWITYKDPNKPLIDSDLNLINKCKSFESKVETEIDNQNESESESEKKLALKLSMCLPSSCYATMMCRQITKTESTDLEFKPWLKHKFNL